MTSMQERPSRMARNLRAAFDLFETGVAMMRQRLRREHPDATDAEIDIRLCQWLQHRPGAEAGQRRPPGGREPLRMTMLESSLREIVRHLTEAQIGFALVGGLGVSVRTEPRFTRDTDLVVAAGTDAEAEALVHRLRALGFGLHSVVEQEAVGPLAAARLLPQGEPGGPVVCGRDRARPACARGRRGPRIPPGT